MIPTTSINIRGDRKLGMDHVGAARSILKSMENFMKFQGLKQLRWSRKINDEIRVDCWSCFSLRGITIYAGGGAKEDDKKYLPFCFANRTVALAQIVSVDGVVPSEDPDTCEKEPVCDTCIDPSSYPAGYYCTKEIRYSVLVCDTKANYLLFEGIPSTDFTPHCPEDWVLVVIHLTTNLPGKTLLLAETNPRAESFTFPEIFYAQNLKEFSILPFVADIPKDEVREVNVNK